MNEDVNECLVRFRDVLTECEDRYGGRTAFVALGIVVACVLESRDGQLIATAIQVAREKILAQKD